MEILEIKDSTINCITYTIKTTVAEFYDRHVVITLYANPKFPDYMLQMQDLAYCVVSISAKNVSKLLAEAKKMNKIIEVQVQRIRKSDKSFDYAPSDDEMLCNAAYGGPEL